MINKLNSGDLRMLGSIDGFAHALVWVRMQIAAIDGLYAPRIDPCHMRKREARDAVLQPLRELEHKIKENHTATMAAYQKTRGNAA